eukprot:327303-Pleurochrysis_carterae.AAC.2
MQALEARRKWAMDDAFKGTCASMHLLINPPADVLYASAALCPCVCLMERLSLVARIKLIVFTNAQKDILVWSDTSRWLMGESEAARRAQPLPRAFTLRAYSTSSTWNDEPLSMQGTTPELCKQDDDEVRLVMEKVPQLCGADSSMADIHAFRLCPSEEAHDTHAVFF